MRKEYITQKEAISIMMIFLFGSSFILGIGAQSKNDAWISGIVGLIMAIPFIFIYARVSSLFPEKDLFEMLDMIFGKIIGRIFSILYIWYSFHLGALVVRNFGEFIITVAMPETPLFVSMLCLTIVNITVVRSGIEVMGRTSAYLLPVLLFIIIAVQIMGFPLFNFSNIKPLFGNGWSLILLGSTTAFAFPFAESVIFISILSSLKPKSSHYKVFFIGTLVSGILIILITLRNILTLGGLQANIYFPAHVAVSRINIGEFLQRIEITVALVFVVGAFIKTSVCLLVACKGIAYLFHLNDYRSTVIQVALLMLYLSVILYGSIMEMGNWAFQTYFYYAFPFQVIFPIIILITAEIKVRKNKSTAAA